LLDGPEMTPWAEAALYASARAELVERVIRPARERGAWVVCDRYIDSSVAYQGVGRGLGLGRVLELNLGATRGLLPDLTFVLLVAPAEANTRSTGLRDRIEREGTTSSRASTLPTWASRRCFPCGPSSSTGR